MASTQIIDDGRIHLGSDPFRPSLDVPEIRTAQKIDVEGLFGRRFRLLLLLIGLDIQPPRDASDVYSRTIELRLAVLDLDLDVLRLHDLAKVLHTHISAGTDVTGGIVLPGLGIDAPSSLWGVFVPQRIVQGKATHQHDLASRFTQGRDPRRRVPPSRVRGVVISQAAGELGVGVVARSFTLDGHDDRLGGVGVQKGQDVIDQVAEITLPSQRDGELAMHEHQSVFGRVIGVFGLDADVEKADAVVELLGHADGLALHGRKGVVVRGRVMCAWDAERGEWSDVFEATHPAGWVGGGEESQVGILR